MFKKLITELFSYQWVIFNAIADVRACEKDQDIKTDHNGLWCEVWTEFNTIKMFNDVLCEHGKESPISTVDQTSVEKL